MCANIALKAENRNASISQKSNSLLKQIQDYISKHC